MHRHGFDRSAQGHKFSIFPGQNDAPIFTEPRLILGIFHGALLFLH